MWLAELTVLKCYQIDSRSEYLFRTRSVATSLGRNNHSYSYAVLQCYGEYGVIPYSLLIWARLTELKLVLLVATEQLRIPLLSLTELKLVLLVATELFRIPLVATNWNEE